MKLEIPDAVRRMAAAPRSLLAGCRAKVRTGSARVAAWLRSGGWWARLRGLGHRVGRSARAALSVARALPRVLADLPRHAKAGLLALARLRPTPRLWTLVLAVGCAGLGGFLVIAPARELATGKSFSLEALLTLSWLATGAAMVAAGAGIILRAASFRRFLLLALICSVPLPAAFGYKTFNLAVKMRTASPEVHKHLEPWVSGGVQLSLFFLAVTGFLLFMLRSKHLRFLQCTGSFLDGRSGLLVGGALGGALGSGAGYLVWLGFRWLGYERGIGVFRDGVSLVRVDYFVAIGAACGATLLVYRALRRLRSSPRPRPVLRSAAPPAPPAPGPAASTAPQQPPVPSPLQTP